tara:strand:+ start:141 stop:671 length:531 start_codon:yes stop_codon:yes gene_type:complete
MISSTGCSEFDVGPGGLVLLLWVESSWIRELTIVVLGVEGSLSILADLDVVGDELSVGHVLVKIILKMLDQVHVLLDEIVSSNSWEREGSIVKLPGVDGKLWGNSELLLEFIIDLHGIIVMLSVETSREIIQLNVKLLLADWKGTVAWDLNVELVSWWDLEVDGLGRSSQTKEGDN